MAAAPTVFGSIEEGVCPRAHRGVNGAKIGANDFNSLCNCGLPEHDNEEGGKSERLHLCLAIKS